MFLASPPATVSCGKPRTAESSYVCSDDSKIIAETKATATSKVKAKPKALPAAVNPEKEKRKGKGKDNEKSKYICWHLNQTPADYQEDFKFIFSRESSARIANVEAPSVPSQANVASTINLPASRPGVQ